MELIHRLNAYFQAIDPEHTIEVGSLVSGSGDTARVDLDTASAHGHRSLATPILAWSAQSFRPTPAPSGLDFVPLACVSPC